MSHCMESSARGIRCVRARLVLLTALLSLLPLLPAAASQVVQVRVGEHPEFTRVVFELDGRAGYKVERKSGPQGTEFIVTLDASSATRKLSRRGSDVAHVEVTGGDHAVARIRLRKGDLALKEMILSNPYRVVLDVMRAEPIVAKKRAAPTQKTVATKEAAQPSSEKTAAEKAAAEKVAAEKAAAEKLAAEKKAAAEKVAAEKAAADKAAAEKVAAEKKAAAEKVAAEKAAADKAAAEKVAAEKKAAAEKLAAEKAAADKAAAEKVAAEKKAAAEKLAAEKAAADKAAAEKLAAEKAAADKAAAEKLAAEKAAADKAAAEKVAAEKAAADKAAAEKLAAEKAAADKAAAEKVAAEKAAADKVAAEKAAAEKVAQAPPPPAPAPTPAAAPAPVEPLAPSPAERPAAVAKAEKPAPKPDTAPPTLKKEPKGASRWFESPLWLAGAGGALLCVLAAAFVLRRRRALPNDLDVTAIAEGHGDAADAGESASEAGMHDESSFAGLFDDDNTSVPARETAPPVRMSTPKAKSAPVPTGTPLDSLFDDDDAQAEPAREGAQMSTPTDLPMDRTIRGAARGAAAAPAAGGDVMRLVQELERRLGALESKLDQANEAREKLERQVAAQSEELRVQRAAIARTQRALRTMSRGDEEKATEPALREETQTKIRPGNL